MKRFLSILLSLLTVFLCFAVFPVGALSSGAVELPEAVDLSTEYHLPPIANQGAVGACVSMGATYMQLTNAYSRYLHELDPEIVWDPSTGNANYCFSPRFTYNLGGAATAPVYEILQEQGSPTQKYAAFSGGVTGYANNDNTARNWATEAGSWDQAQTYRIKNFDQVWVKDACGYNFKTTKGKALIERIKTHLNNGNVVVTGGYPDRWVTDLVRIVDTGTYGKTNEIAIPYSTNVPSGGHQVAIVGYDDNITCVKNGVTLKGAFKVANSWGTTWQNKGFIWMMYDALNDNGLSAYSALNVENRIWTMDQFIFLDYRTDLNYGTPELTVRVNLTTGDRDCFAVTLKATDVSTGITESYLPKMFANASIRADYNKGYSFKGSTSASNGTLTFNFDHFTDNLPAGKTTDDYIFSIEVSYVSTDSGKTATVKRVDFLKNGTLCKTITGRSDVVSERSPRTYILDDRRPILQDLAPGASIEAIDGEYCGTVGSSFSFRVKTASGYKVSSALDVRYNGERLIPEGGVYTLTVADGQDLSANTVCVRGVVPTRVLTVDLTKYGDGFEKPYSSYWMVFTIPRSSVNSDVVDQRAIERGEYKYTIRIHVDGICYDFTPESYYDFGSTLLYRVNVADQGWFPTLNRSYTLKIEFCLKGVVIYTDNSFAVTCTLAPTSVKQTAHTHSFTGETCVQTGSGCGSEGVGYRRCSTPGCKAMKKVVLEKDERLHTFDNTWTLTKKATRSSQGEYSARCTACGTNAVCSRFWAQAGDATGDDLLTIEDIAVFLNILASREDDLVSACDIDLNGDGVFSIKDLNRLLTMIENS